MAWKLGVDYLIDCRCCKKPVRLPRKRYMAMIDAATAPLCGGCRKFEAYLCDWRKEDEDQGNPGETAVDGGGGG